MDPIQALIGNWKIQSGVAPEDEFMHIDGEGRIVHFICADEMCSRTIPMRLWAEYLEGNCYSIQAKLDCDTWTVEMASTSEGLRIKNRHKTFLFVRAEESELPDWYDGRLQTALAKMAEAESTANNQD